MSKRKLMTIISCCGILLSCGSFYFLVKYNNNTLASGLIKNKSSYIETNATKTNTDTSKDMINRTLPKVESSSDAVDDKGPAASETLTKLDFKDKVSLAVDKPLYPKEVFLTFDDGPSSDNTYKILNILKENNVKATFFIIGKMAEEYPDRLKAIKNAGMSIQNHSYSHDYKMYESISTCENDFGKANDVFKKLIDKNPTQFIRFPGGSDNRVSNGTTMANIRRDIISKGIYYIDWNVSSTDASPSLVPADKIFQIVTESCRNKNFAVVLMHDTHSKTTTVQALPAIIKYLKEQGFIFRSFDDVTPTELKEMVRERIADR